MTVVPVSGRRRPASPSRTRSTKTSSRLERTGVSSWSFPPAARRRSTSALTWSRSFAERSKWPLTRSTDGARLAEGGEEGVVDAGRDQLVARARGRQVLDPARRRDAAGAQHGDAVARALDLGEQVRVEQHGLSPLRLLLEEVADLAPADRIHAVGRLVEEQHLRIVDERRREAQPLRHALGELLHADVRPFREPDALEQLRRAPPQRGRSPRPTSARRS